MTKVRPGERKKAARRFEGVFEKNRD